MPYLAKEYPPLSTQDILSWGFDNPQFDQDRPLWIDATDPSRSISANEARILITKLVAGFRNAGLEPGDTVCIAAFGDIYYSILILGIIAAGCVFTGTNPGSTPLELEHHFRASRTRMIISEPDLLAPILATSAATDLLAHPTPRILTFDHHTHPSTPLPTAPSPHPTWRTLLAHAPQPWLRPPAATTTAMLLFSSGTSGTPKPIPLTHANLTAQHTLALASPPPPWPVRRLSFLPPFHAAVVPSTHISPIRAGDPTFVLARFTVASFLRAVEACAITDLIIVPPALVAVVKFAAEGRGGGAGGSAKVRAALRSVRWVRVGAAPCGRDVQAEFQELVGAQGVVTQVFGMTETSCIAMQCGPGEREGTGSVGRPVAGLDVKVVDEEGREVEEVEGWVRGELCVRGPTVVGGYADGRGGVGREEWDGEGFLRTGDVVAREGRTGLWYVSDRKKELIKVRGWQVAPAELEAVLLGHPDVVDAAVLGVFDSGTQSELPRAYVVRRPGSQGVTAEAIKDWIKERLAKYKWLEGGVVFLDAIPKTASGKILKRVLREWAKEEMGREHKL